jgi:dTDP-4-dehydrorhamnose reductase
MKVLYIGGRGSLTLELEKFYNKILTPTTDELDLTKKNNIEKFFVDNDFDIIIHNSSLLNIRICEGQKDEAMKINVTSTKNLVEVIQMKKPNIQFIHISTPCVFDGKSGMYIESSIPYPVNFYGLTRLLGEYIVEKLSQYTIIRTNYVSRKKWPYPKAFTDRFGTYLFPDGVAQGIYDIQKENISGIIHVVGDKKISLYDFAKITTPDIQPMTMSDYSGPPLTIDMSLDSERWKKYRLN